MEADVAPVINSYKWSFFIKRFTETVLGGMRLYTGKRQPILIYVVQIVLYLLPLTLVTPFILTANYSLYPNIGIPIACAGVAMAILVFFTQTIAFAVPRIKKSDDPFGSPVDLIASMLDEDEEIESFFSKSALAYWMPSRRNFGVVLLNALLSGLIGAGLVWSLRPARIAYHFSSEGFSWVVFVLGLFTFINCQYSLTVRSPPEVSQYQSYNMFEDLLRPIYVLLFIAADVICGIIFTYEPIYWIEYVNCAIYIVFLLYPVLWTLGILAHFDVLFSWASEVALIHLLGGTAAASNSRLAIMAVTAWTANIIIFLVYYFSSQALGVFIAAGFGFILSQEWYIHVIEYIPMMILSKLPSEKLKQRLGYNGSRMNTLKTAVSRAFPKINIWRLTSAVISVIAGIMAIGAGLALQFTNTTLPSRSSSTELWFMLTVGIIEAVILALLVLHCVFSALQHVYLFNLIRNPLWRRIQNSKLTRVIHAIGKIAPILSIAYLLINVDTKPIVTISSTEMFLYVFFECTLLLRSFRHTCQSVWSSYCEIVVVAILNKACVNTGWYDLSMATRLFVIGYGLSRLPVIWGRFRLMGVSLITVAAEPKYRFKRAKPFLILTLIFLLVPITVILFGSVLMLPILPLLGIPFFVLGFPRPLRTWSTCGSSYSLCTDTVFYKHMLPSVLSQFSKMVGRGLLGISVSPGDMFLMRSETFFVLVEVLEKGLGYVSVNVKGLELQTTSCHAVEATYLDDYLQSAYAQSPDHVLNKNYWHLFHPMSETKINTYSIGDIQLTGIFDHPDTFTELHSAVAYCMVWVLCHKSVAELKQLGLYELMSKGTVRLQQDQTDTLFPNGWFEYLINEKATLHNEFNDENDLTGAMKHFVTLCFMVVEQQFNRNKKVSAMDVLRTFSGIAPSFKLEKASMFRATNNSNFDNYQHAFSMIDEELELMDRKKKKNSVAGPQKDDASEGIPEWLREEEDQDIERGRALLQCFIKAYQYAVKLSLDKTIYEGSNLTVPEESEFDEWRDTLNEYDEKWVIASKQDDNNIINEKPNIFLLEGDDGTSNKKKASVYRAKSLTLQEMPFWVGKLDAESVRAIWNSLNLELFYFTNDDDERYSIQAHKLLMRNICVQAAEPPLGYPIYSSGPISISVAI
jgi:hypothetical protein